MSTVAVPPLTTADFPVRLALAFALPTDMAVIAMAEVHKTAARLAHFFLLLATALPSSLPDFDPKPKPMPCPYAWEELSLSQA
jgi:hypothetical protein